MSPYLCLKLFLPLFWIRSKHLYSYNFTCMHSSFIYWPKWSLSQDRSKVLCCFLNIPGKYYGLDNCLSRCKKSVISILRKSTSIKNIDRLNHLNLWLLLLNCDRTVWVGGLLKVEHQSECHISALRGFSNKDFFKEP